MMRFPDEIEFKVPAEYRFANELCETLHIINYSIASLALYPDAQPTHELSDLNPRQLHFVIKATETCLTLLSRASAFFLEQDEVPIGLDSALSEKREMFRRIRLDLQKAARAPFQAGHNDAENIHETKVDRILHSGLQRFLTKDSELSPAKAGQYLQEPISGYGMPVFFSYELAASCQQEKSGELTIQEFLKWYGQTSFEILPPEIAGNSFFTYLKPLLDIIQKMALDIASPEEQSASAEAGPDVVARRAAPQNYMGLVRAHGFEGALDCAVYELQQSYPGPLMAAAVTPLAKQLKAMPAAWKQDADVQQTVFDTFHELQRKGLSPGANIQQQIEQSLQGKAKQLRPSQQRARAKILAKNIAYGFGALAIAVAATALVIGVVGSIIASGGVAGPLVIAAIGVAYSTSLITPLATAGVGLSAGAAVTISRCGFLNKPSNNPVDKKIARLEKPIVASM